MGTTRLFGWAALVSGIILSALGVSLAGPWIGQPGRALVSDIVVMLLAAAMSAAMFARARRAGSSPRRPWLLLGAAGVLWTLGETAWFLNSHLQATPADPSAADAFYLAALVPAGCAVVCLIRRETSRAGLLRQVLAGLLVGCSVLFLGWSLALSTLAPAADMSALSWTVYLAYPVLDLVLVSLVVLLLADSGAGVRLQRGLLAGGILAYTVSDIAYSYSGAVGEFEAGALADLGWAAGYVLIALAALAPTGQDGPRPWDAARTPESSSSSLVEMVTVYLPLLAVVVVAAALPGSLDDPVLVVTGTVLLVVFGVRQALLSIDLHELHLAQKARVEELETGRSELWWQVQQNDRILASVAEGVIGVDARGRITFVNPYAERLLGLPAENLVGSSHRRLHGGDQSAFPAGSTCAIETVLRAGAGTVHESDRFRRGDGTVFEVELAAGLLVDQAGTAGAVAVFRDVSERRRVERMKDEFMSVVSHELRTPLSAIRGSLGLLGGGLGGSLNEQGGRMVRVALASSERLSRLIEDMLDAERLESGATPMRQAPVEAGLLVETTLEGLLSVAAENGVRLRQGTVEGTVNADSDRLVQALTNIVGNAIKFSGTGGLVHVSAVAVGGAVEFSVSDTGRGIPEDQVESIFERFVQVDAADHHERGGTGLGLAISRSIVERHGGRIWVESRWGEGSIFRFTIPLTDAAPDDDVLDDVLDGVPAGVPADSTHRPPDPVGARTGGKE